MVHHAAPVDSGERRKVARTKEPAEPFSRPKLHEEEEMAARPLYIEGTQKSTPDERRREIADEICGLLGPTWPIVVRRNMGARYATFVFKYGSDSSANELLDRLMDIVIPFSQQRRGRRVFKSVSEFRPALSARLAEKMLDETSYGRLARGSCNRLVDMIYQKVPGVLKNKLMLRALTPDIEKAIRARNGNISILAEVLPSLDPENADRLHFYCKRMAERVDTGFTRLMILRTLQALLLMEDFDRAQAIAFMVAPHIFPHCTTKQGGTLAFHCFRLIDAKARRGVLKTLEPEDVARTAQDKQGFKALLGLMLFTDDTKRVSTNIVSALQPDLWHDRTVARLIAMVTSDQPRKYAPADLHAYLAPFNTTKKDPAIRAFELASSFWKKHSKDEELLEHASGSTKLVLHCLCDNNVPSDAIFAALGRERAVAEASEAQDAEENEDGSEEDE